MDNPEKQTTLGTQDKQNKKTNKTKAKKQKNTTQKTRMMSNTDPANNRW